MRMDYCNDTIYSSTYTSVGLKKKVIQHGNEQ